MVIHYIVSFSSNTSSNKSNISILKFDLNNNLEVINRRSGKRIKGAIIIDHISPYVSQLNLVYIIFLQLVVTISNS